MVEALTFTVVGTDSPRANPDSGAPIAAKPSELQSTQRP